MWSLDSRPQALIVVDPRHVGSSWTRDRTRVSCTGRQVIPEPPGKPHSFIVFKKSFPPHIHFYFNLQATPCSMWDIISPTRDQTHTP